MAQPRRLTWAQTEEQTEVNTYAYHVRHRNGWASGFGPRPTHCSQCGEAFPADTGESIGTGYGCGEPETISEHPDAPTKLARDDTLERSPAFCYVCCGKRDEKQMIEDGHITLYLANGMVTNWPNTLQFKPHAIRAGSHNIGRYRHDVWFTGPDGFIWHGINIGDSQILRCKRTKAK